MSRLILRFAFCLVLALAVALPLLRAQQPQEPNAGAGKAKPIRLADVPRLFQGQFEWKNSGQPYTLMLRIDKIERKAGEICFTGSHLYKSADYQMKVTGVIDPKSRRLSIQESQPNRADAEIEGVFVGTIAEDLQSIEAVWTSAATGLQGDLKVRAVKKE